MSDSLLGKYRTVWFVFPLSKNNLMVDKSISEKKAMQAFIILGVKRGKKQWCYFLYFQIIYYNQIRILMNPQASCQIFHICFIRIALHTYIEYRTQQIKAIHSKTKREEKTATSKNKCNQCVLPYTCLPPGFNL